jgi:hypothetical protein
MGHFGYSMSSTDHELVVSAPGEGNDEWGKGRIYIYNNDGYRIINNMEPKLYFMGLDFVLTKDRQVWTLLVDIFQKQIVVHSYDLLCDNPEPQVQLTVGYDIN